MFQSSIVNTPHAVDYARGLFQAPQSASYYTNSFTGSDMGVQHTQLSAHHEHTDSRALGGVPEAWQGLYASQSPQSQHTSPASSLPSSPSGSSSTSPSRRRKTNKTRKVVPKPEQHPPKNPNCFMRFRRYFQAEMRAYQSKQVILTKAAGAFWYRIPDEGKRPFCEAFMQAKTNGPRCTFERHCIRGHQDGSRAKASDEPDPDQEEVDRLIEQATQKLHPLLIGEPDPSVAQWPQTVATHSVQGALSNSGPPHLSSRPVWAGACAPQVSYQLDVTRPTRPVTPVTVNPVTTFPSPSSSHSSAASLSDDVYDFNQFPLTMPYYDTSFEVPPPLPASNFDLNSGPPLQVGAGNLSGFFDPNQITDSIYNHPFGGLAVNDDTPQRTFGGADDNLLTPFPGEMFDATRHYPNINF